MMSGPGWRPERRRRSRPYPWQALRRQLRGGLAEAERAVLPLALLAVVGVGLSAGYAGADVVPPGVVLVPLLASALLLRVRAERIVIGATAIMLVFDLVTLGISGVRVGMVVAIVVAAGLAHWTSAHRERLGVPGLRGESMLVELRDKLREQGELPVLPHGWGTDIALEAAGGGSFGGDFLVSSVTGDGNLLELALVDVSGKGIDAGTRALLFSGALGGLLGAVPPSHFLPAANDYLYRQSWDEGFATSVHLILDLATGEYSLESAGHPPAVHFDAGSGRWGVSEASGVALGLLPKASYDVERGTLRRGDALLLYTDGVVEVPGRDLVLGIDKFVGEAEKLIPSVFTGGSARLLAAMRTHTTDDRALVLLWRR